MEQGQPSNNQFYVVFELNKYEYAIPINNVNEVIPITEVTPVPNEVPYILGIINLKGKIVPIIDLGLRIKTLIDSKVDQNKNYKHFLIVGTASSPIGLKVEKVVDIISIDKNDIKPISADQKICEPKFLSGQVYISEIGKLEEGKNIEKILKEIKEIAKKSGGDTKKVVYILNVDSVIYQEESLNNNSSII